MNAKWVDRTKCSRMHAANCSSGEPWLSWLHLVALFISHPQWNAQSKFNNCKTYTTTVQTTHLCECYKSEYNKRAMSIQGKMVMCNLIISLTRDWTNFWVLMWFLFAFVTTKWVVLFFAALLVGVCVYCQCGRTWELHLSIASALEIFFVAATNPTNHNVVCSRGLCHNYFGVIQQPTEEDELWS